ncbi:MAG: GNAT family N-acetyltransferase [Candidatus Dormiibacterota bacterium]
MATWTIDGRAALSAAEKRAVSALRAACEEAEPLDLKLEIDEVESAGVPIHFLAGADGEVIGYAAITPGAEAEVCGMVHPAWRRRGMGKALLDQVLGAARRLERPSVLVICEDSGPVALAWLRRAGGSDEESELRMTLRLAGDDPRSGSERRPEALLELRSPGVTERAALLALLGEGFHESAEQVGDRLDATPEDESLVAIESGQVVGTLRLTTTPRRSMIYGFVVDKERRGQRLGTRMLEAVLTRLRAARVAEVGLEVDPENTPAVRLYRAFGFEAVTTYRYLRLDSAKRKG